MLNYTILGVNISSLDLNLLLVFEALLAQVGAGIQQVGGKGAHLERSTVSHCP